MKEYLKPIVIYDIEATCGDNIGRNQQETIEIGAVKIYQGNICDRFSKYIKPKNNPILTEYCKSLTHISQKDIDNAEPFCIVFREFLDWCNDAVMCSWTGFDSFVLFHDMDRNRMHDVHEILNKYKVDIKQIYASVNHLGHSFKNPHNFSLESALEAEHIPFEGNQHRAIDDAENTSMLYFKYRKAIDHILALRFDSK